MFESPTSHVTAVWKPFTDPAVVKLHPHLISVGKLDKKALSLQPLRELRQNNRYLDTRLHLGADGNCLVLLPNLLSFTPPTVQAGQACTPPCVSRRPSHHITIRATQRFVNIELSCETWGAVKLEILHHD